MLDLMDMSRKTAFLGSEFLLWLWYRCEEDDGMFVVEGNRLELGFDDQLVLESHLAEAEQSRLKGGAPAYAPEAHKALQVGKMVRRARMKLVKDEREWSFYVDALTLSTAAVRIPALLTDGDDEQFLERMYLIEELDIVLRDLYRQFLLERLNARWEDRLAQIRAWIAQPTSDEIGAR